MRRTPIYNIRYAVEDRVENVSKRGQAGGGWLRVQRIILREISAIRTQVDKAFFDLFLRR